MHRVCGDSANCFQEGERGPESLKRAMAGHHSDGSNLEMDPGTLIEAQVAHSSRWALSYCFIFPILGKRSFFEYNFGLFFKKKTALRLQV